MTSSDWPDGESLHDYKPLFIRHDAFTESGPEIKRYAAETIRRCVTYKISEQELLHLRPENVTAIVERRMGDMLIMLEHDIVGLPKEKISIHKHWPRDWWQAFKEKWFPGWAVNRWPVICDSVNVEQTIYCAVCPHLDNPDRATHLSWMAEQQENH